MARQQKSGVNGELIRFLFDRPGVRSKENNVLLSGNDLKTDVDGLLCRGSSMAATALGFHVTRSAQSASVPDVFELNQESFSPQTIRSKPRPS